MTFETSITLKDCKYTYSLHPNIKKYTLRDNTFAVTKVGNYELNRLLEAVPNSGEGFLLKIIFNKDLTGFKINITDKSGLRLVNIFKNPENDIIQQKSIPMDSLVEREISTKQRPNMVTLTYIDAYQVERTTTYPDLAACILAFSGCVTLPDSYSIVSIDYKGEKLPYTGRVDGLYAF